MKRWILAIAVLLGPVVGMVWSDYVVILVDLTRLEESQAKKGKDGKSVVGTPLFPGAGALGGGNLGQLGGAMGLRGGGGAMGQRGGGQLGPGPGGALGGAFGNRGGGGALGGGFGARGGPGMQFGAMGGPGQGGAEEDTAGHLYAIAYLEIKNKLTAPLVLRGKYYEIDTAIGKAYVPVEMVLKDVQTESVTKRFRDMRRVYYKQAKQLPSAANLLHLAGWALQHGLHKEFLATMDDLVKVDPKNASAAAYVQVRKDLDRSLSQDEPGGKLFEKLEGYQPVRSTHYTLWKGITATKEEAQRYLAELERTYETFFYWFALKGRAVSMPARRLVAVLEPNRETFDQLHASFDASPLVADGFLARRENLAVLSSKRTDEAYQTLDKINTSLLSELHVQREDLLHEKIYKMPAVRGQGLNLYGYQTLALLQKAMEEESVKATATHEGLRQLLAATGLIPRNVGGPEWVRFGLASFLETSNKAYYHSAGLQSWLYLKPFKDLVKEKNRASNEELLLGVVGDRYFWHAQASQRQSIAQKDDKELHEALQEKADKELEKARSTAWALTYYLVQKPATREQLEQFLAEVAALPRDQEFGADVLTRCFGRAFGLLDAADPMRLDPAKVQGLATRWVSEMEGEKLEVDIKVELPKKDPTKKPPAGGNRGGFPGGIGPGGPGGPGAWLSPRERDPQRPYEAILGRHEFC